MSRLWSCLGLLVLLSCELAVAEASAAKFGDPIHVESWRVIGPFEMGSREGFVDHLASTPVKPEGSEGSRYEWQYPSIHGHGGLVGWKKVESKREEGGGLTGAVDISFPEVDWEARQDEWGFAAVLNVAYLEGELDLPGDKPVIALVEAERCSLSIRGRTYLGDPYGRGITRSQVVLQPGKNLIRVRSAGYGPNRSPKVVFHPWIPGTSPSEFVLEKDLLLPDLARGSSGRGWVGVPVMSVLGAPAPVEIEISGAVRGRAGSQFGLAGGTVLKIPVPVEWDPPSVAEGGSELPVRVVVRTSHGSHSVEVKVRVRAPDEARIETFQSRIDRSAQMYGILPPKNFDPSRRYGLILSTHGAGVGPRGQAGSYGQKDWAFVVAPTNRRPFGFDWHDWGRLDFEEVWDVVTERYAIDPDRVILTGHSMGGHGAWLLGAHHADRLAAVSPSAGWNSHDLYVPPTLRRSRNLAPPEIATLWFRGTATDRVSTFLKNYRNLPVFAVHGSADDNVPPTQARLLVNALRDLGGSVRLLEEPGVGHWWDLDEDRPGADCVDHEELNRFWVDARRKKELPADATLVTADPDVNRRLHGIELERPIQIGTVSEIRRWRDERGWHVSTRNVESFALKWPRVDKKETITLDIDGQTVAATKASRQNGVSRFVRNDRGAWVRNRRPSSLRAGPNEFPGGYKKALFDPFLIVVGTNAEWRESSALEHAATLLSTRWWRRANGFAPVIRDVDLTDTLRASYNLVLLGGPGQNKETSRLAPDLGAIATPKGLHLSGLRIPGNHLASAHWEPNPFFPRRKVMVMQSTSPESAELLPLLNPIGSGVGLPDYVVIDASVKTRSWAGFQAAGYWTPDWRFDPDNAWPVRSQRSRR